MESAAKPPASGSGFGGSNPLFPTNYFQLLTARMGGPKRPTYSCTRCSTSANRINTAILSTEECKTAYKIDHSTVMEKPDALPSQSQRDVGDRHIPADILHGIRTGSNLLLLLTNARAAKVDLTRASHDSSIVLRFEMISRARSWFIFSNTDCDAKRATTLPGISYCTSSVTCAFGPLGSIL